METREPALSVDGCAAAGAARCGSSMAASMLLPITPSARVLRALLAAQSQMAARASRVAFGELSLLSLVFVKRQR